MRIVRYFAEYLSNLGIWTSRAIFGSDNDLCERPIRRKQNGGTRAKPPPELFTAYWSGCTYAASNACAARSGFQEAFPRYRHQATWPSGGMSSVTSSTTTQSSPIPTFGLAVSPQSRAARFPARV